jgi:hypothetical protein
MAPSFARGHAERRCSGARPQKARLLGPLPLEGPASWWRVHALGSVPDHFSTRANWGLFPPVPLAVVLAAAFGVELESAAGVASEGVAEVIAGPEGDSALGLIQQRGRRANVGSWPVGDTAAREHVDHFG